VPGNHDIGDNPWPGGPDESFVSRDRLARWRETIGPDRWSGEYGPWTLLAINAQLLGSGLDAEVEEWSWLQDAIHGRATGRPIVLILHKPLVASDAELEMAPLPTAKS
jgi:alkaline phosphatase D